MKPRVETVLSVTLTVTVVVVATSVLRRDFLAAKANRADSAHEKPIHITRWEDLLADGSEIGTPSSKVRIIEFVDLECPYCARWHESLREMSRQSEAPVSVTVVHMPLARHRFAKAAAIATECAGAQGHFADFLDVTFGKQDSIGLKSWWSYAREAAVTDSAEFARCMAGPQPERVTAGLRWASELGVKSTPTFVVNGWRLARPPEIEELTQMIQTIQSGGDLFGAKRSRIFSQLIRRSKKD